MLNIKGALELYRLIGEFIPEAETSSDYLDYSGIIIHNIRVSETPERFGEALLLMYPDENVQTLSEKETTEIIELFITGLIRNEFISLVEFCRQWLMK